MVLHCRALFLVASQTDPAIAGFVSFGKEIMLTISGRLGPCGRSMIGLWF